MQVGWVQVRDLSSSVCGLIARQPAERAAAGLAAYCQIMRRAGCSANAVHVQDDARPRELADAWCTGRCRPRLSCWKDSQQGEVLRGCPPPGWGQPAAAPRAAGPPGLLPETCQYDIMNLSGTIQLMMTNP